MSRSWVELGLMQGNPPPPDKRVTLDDYDKGVHPRWSMLHMRELVPSARVAASSTPRILPRELRDLSGVPFQHEGREHRFAEVFDRTDVDAMIVVHRGAVVLEHYDDGVGPDSRHVAQSVTKSVVATLAGIAIHGGLLDPTAPVTAYLPELAGTSWEGATVQQLLDMRTSTSFDESDYEDPESESMRGFRILGWLTRRPDDPLPQEYIADLRNEGGEHGSRFEYRSIITDVIGWVLERVSGKPLASLMSETLWGPMGAAYDADLLLGPLSFPLSSGGLCLTVEDLARFGLLHLEGGTVDGREVVPRAWVESITRDDDGLAASFAADVHAETFPAGAFYHQQWWVLDPAAGVFSGFGIHGQQVLVHPPSQTVVAKFSSWEHPVDDDHVAFAGAALVALCDHLATS